MHKPPTGLAYWRKTLNTNWITLAVIVFLVLFPHIVGWITGDSPFGVGGRPRGQSIFWQSIFIEVFVLAILAMSYNLMFGFTGVISFGHALFFGLGGYTLGIVMEKYGFVSYLVEQMGMSEAVGTWVALTLGIVIALGIAGLIGFVMGLVSLRLKGVYFAIFTLAVAEMGFIWVGRWGFTQAEDGFPLTYVPDLINPTQNRLTYYYLAMLLAIAVFLIIRRLMNSPTGRVLLAIRENEDRAQTIGYNTLRYKLLSITLASMMAALAGIIHVGLNKKIGPEIMSVQFTIEPLLMTIIGGIGTFSGPVIGASVLHLSEKILDREFLILGAEINVGEYWSLMLGIAFIIVVLVFPQGVVGTLNRWFTNMRTRRKIPPVPTEQAPAAGD